LTGPGDRDAPNATIVERDDLTEDIARFTVRPDDEVPPFRPGQYLALGLRIDDRLVQRPYSTASRATSDETLEFLIRRVPGGALTPRLWAAPGGGRVRLGRPKGLFTLLPDDSRTQLFVATGTGLAPFMAMLDELLARPVPPRVGIVHGVARATELGYRGR
jgi:ferredoxin-NADP reductase